MITQYFISILVGACSLFGITTSDIEQKMIDYGMVSVVMLDPTIKVGLAYSTTNNFVKTDMYGDFDKAYLLPEIAEMVVKAQRILKKQYPNYSLLIIDAARPMSVQQRMFKMVAGTPLNIYVVVP
ncbi:MAG: hypothetical protein RR277_07760 [Rikenellaceae bacterium]